MQKRFLVYSGFSGAIAVALGALGAHFLKTKVAAGVLTLDNLQAFETAARYQMYHSIALIAVALLTEKIKNNLLPKAGYCFMIGIVLFSGSVYLLSTASLIGLSDVHWLGPITPIGGLFFITGWLLLAFASIKHSRN